METEKVAPLGFTASLSKKFDSLPDLDSQPCIYKAPDYLRHVNQECYLPYVVSIGPFYYKHASLENQGPMEDCKVRCLQFLLQEDDTDSRNLKLEHYRTILRDMEVSIRNCYAERILLTSDEFNEMILLDSAFIICLFMESHPSLSSSSTSSSLEFLRNIYKRILIKWGFKLKRDLFLSENQIPLFVLDRLYTEAFGPTYPNTSFLELACSFIGNGGIPVIYGRTIDARHATNIKNEHNNIAHLVDLLNKICFPSQVDQTVVESNSFINVVFPSSASNLTAAGVKFAPSKSRNLLDITFSKGVLEIPTFQLWDVSESYYRSMILFEQSHLPINNNAYLLHYIVLLEKLIQTPKDVQILVRSGIIDNWIGSEETVTKLFNGSITKHIPIPEKFYYFDVCKKLNAYANTRWNQWKTILKRDYFSHPWATISVIFALALFLLTLLQTIGTFTNK